MKKYVCTICGYIYDEAAGDVNNGVPAGTKWDSLDDAWTCPVCGAPKDDFEEQKLEDKSKAIETSSSDISEHDLKALSDAEMSAVFSNLAKGCEKQYQAEATECYNQLAEYYQKKCEQNAKDDTENLSDKVKKDLDAYDGAKASVQKLSDRGSLRALVWSEKVSRIVSSILNRYEKQGTDLLKDKKIYVCEICGFVYIGSEAPDICPVCKVPKLKISEVSKEAI